MFKSSKNKFSFPSRASIVGWMYHSSIHVLRVDLGLRHPSELTHSCEAFGRRSFVYKFLVCSVWSDSIPFNSFSDKIVPSCFISRYDLRFREMSTKFLFYLYVGMHCLIGYREIRLCHASYLNLGSRHFHRVYFRRSSRLVFATKFVLGCVFQSITTPILIFPSASFLVFRLSKLMVFGVPFTCFARGCWFHEVILTEDCFSTDLSKNGHLLLESTLSNPNKNIATSWLTACAM